MSWSIKPRDIFMAITALHGCSTMSLVIFHMGSLSQQPPPETGRKVSLSRGPIAPTTPASG